MSSLDLPDDVDHLLLTIRSLFIALARAESYSRADAGSRDTSAREGAQGEVKRSAPPRPSAVPSLQLDRIKPAEKIGDTHPSPATIVQSPLRQAVPSALSAVSFLIVYCVNQDHDAAG